MLKLPALFLTVALGAQGTLRGTQPVPPQRPFLRRDTASRVLYTKILTAEDRRVYSEELAKMLNGPHAGVRRRAAMAIGRIGDRRGTAALLDQLSDDGTVNAEQDPDVRADVVFALGELEDPRAVARLLELLANLKTTATIRARADEALGKIAANPDAAAALGAAKLQQMATAVEGTLPPVDRDLKDDDLLLARLAITALLRLKQTSSIAPLTTMLSSRSADVRWQAANALARLHPDAAAAPAAVARLTAMLKAQEPLERANAARALGAMKAKQSLEAVVPLVGDADQRVVVSAIRALGSFGDAHAAAPLNALGDRLLAGYARYVADKNPGVPPEQNLLLEVATTLGAIKDPSSLPLLQRMRTVDGHAGANPETEVAVAAYGEQAFFDVPQQAAVPAEWRHVANYAQGLGALGGDRAKQELLDILAGKRFGQLDARTVPDVLTALAALKVDGLEALLVEQLKAKDFVVRATAASLLGERFAPSGSEATFQALDAALRASASDTDVDAKLAIMEALSKYRRQRTLDLLAASLKDTNYLVWRHAAVLLEKDGAGTFLLTPPKETFPSRRPGYYERVEAMMRQPNPTAIVSTEKGEFRVELLAHEAPMTVDSFVDLARQNYFNGIAFHRVVPNFVVQGGDPRGDGNGGPGYQIRCEINKVPYDRGTIGMALSGKDTGGSQFFITHSPQPHLDGGYTVFGRVLSGMETVDQLARGDRILKVTVVDGSQ